MSTAERVNHLEVSDNYVLQRSISAYLQAAKLIAGKVLEIGTGSGYGIDYLSSNATEFITLDKFKTNIDLSRYKNVKFLQCVVPPIPFDDNSFDYVVSFQVIEHIRNDREFVKEVHRVLKVGGKFIVTTPNILTTLTRNPWHIREYTKDDLKNRLSEFFTKINMQGIYGNEKVMNYYNHNKAAVQKILRWDIFDLQHHLPAWMLRLPYDVLNRWNRRKLLQDNPLTKDIKADDFYIDVARDDALDWFYIAEK